LNRTGKTRQHSGMAISIGLSAIILFGCASANSGQDAVSLLPPASEGSETSKINVDTKHFQFGDYTSSAWVSDRFEGSWARQFQSDVLHFAVNQTAAEGGVDVGLSEAGFVPRAVSDSKRDIQVCSSYDVDLSGSGRWWAGPKVSVNWQGDEAAKQNGDDWYENYIVEIASSTPQELHDIFTGDYFKAEELPSTEWAGSTYRNYKIRFHSWWQFWSVRQDYRATGALELEPVLDLWIAHGLPTGRTLDGVKANIETYGPVTGNGWMKMSLARHATNSRCSE